MTPQIKDVQLFQILESISMHLTNNCMHLTLAPTTDIVEQNGKSKKTYPTPKLLS